MIIVYILILIAIITVFGNKIVKISSLNLLQNISFEPDKHFKYLYPWEDVLKCFNKTLNAEKYIGHKKCPKCNMNSENLLWIKFRSPRSTWRHQCGRSGPLSICPECKIQVEFILECMN